MKNRTSLLSYNNINLRRIIQPKFVSTILIISLKGVFVTFVFYSDYYQPRVKNIKMMITFLLITLKRPVKI